jgi:hypothetical protein
MMCGTVPEYGAWVIVHRFALGALACQCGTMAVVVKGSTVPKKSSFNSQVFGKIEKSEKVGKP